MNLKEYIRSGMIESYVLGIATEAERQEFESMCEMHPEITQARDEFEKLIETHIMLDAKQPPTHLKKKIWDKLSQTDTEQEEDRYEDGAEQAPVRRLNVWKLLAAASIIGLLAVGYWAFNTRGQYNNLRAENETLQTQLDQTANKLAALEEEEKMLRSPTVIMASLKSMPAAPDANAKVFWDTASKDVFLIINNMPEPASQKQYQLWALLDNKPVNLGMIPKEKKLMIKMKNVFDAQAFAVTLEPDGGSPAPTGDMYVMGKL